LAGARRHRRPGRAGGRREATLFLGEATLSFGRFLRGTAIFQWRDVVLVLQESGPNALPIVTLINFLVGLIIGFVGAVQLQKFGASIYVADLVAIATVRELAPIMTGIIMAGRTEGETRYPEFRNAVARWAAGCPARALVVLGVVAFGARDLAQSTGDRLLHQRRGGGK
jgi:hypothetical protein